MKADRHPLILSPWYRLLVFICMLCPLGLGLESAQASVLYWDSDTITSGNNVDGTGLGGTGSWDLTTSNWWNSAALGLWPNTSADIAVFTSPNALLPTLSTVTLSSGITVGELSFLRSGYTLIGGDLTLAGISPTLRAAMGASVTIKSQILGTEGLTILGGGSIHLTNAANAYTGTTTISSGILSISSNEALGADLSAILVTGSATRGFTGGALMLAGGYSSGVTLTRDVTLQGLGPVPAFGAALLSIGNNTIAGTLTNGSGTLSTGISAAGGRLTLTDVTLAGTTGTTFLTVGVGSSLAGVPGLGSYVITGVLSGTGSIQKSGGGTLIVSPSDAADYTGTFRLYSGSMRFESVAAFGGNKGIAAQSTLDLAGDSASLELRMDSGRIGKNVYNRGGGSPIIFVDHAIGSSALNGTFTLGTLTFDDGETLTFNGRNGYGVSLRAATVLVGDGNSTFANNLNGTLTFAGDFWNDLNNTAARTLTFSGNGDTMINGSIIATAASFDHILTKSGTGTLTITGMASTYNGATNVTGGTLAISGFGSITNNSSVVNIGSTTTAAALDIIGQNLTSDQATTSKVINLAGTTGGGTILADQTGTSPGLIFNASFTATGAGVKTLTLGGANTADNTLNGAIVDSTAATSLLKTGAGTWVLAGANTYTGMTVITDGTLKIKDSLAGTNVLVDSAAVGLKFGSAVATIGTAGGVFQYVGADGVTSAETLGALLPGGGSGTVKVTAGAGGTATLTFASLAQSSSTTLSAALTGSGSTTLSVASTAGLEPGMRLLSGSAAAYVVSISSPTSVIVSAAQVLGLGAVLNFGPGNATVNYVPEAGGSVVFASVPAVGLLSSSSYFNGADFAYAPDTVNATLRAPVYDTDAGFVTAGAALVANSHNLVTGNTSTGAATVLSLKIDGTSSPLVTQTGLLTIRTGAAGTTGGILVTGGTATISGTGVTTGGAADLFIRVDGKTDTLYLNAPITSTTTGGLIKTGLGTLVIGGLNAQTTGGITQLQEGTIQLAAGGRLSANSVNFYMRQNTVFDLNGVNVSQSATASSIGIFSGTGTVTNTSSAAVIFAIAGSGGVFNGNIDETNGRISVVKMGTSATQVFNGLSNYTGSTTIGAPGNGTTGTLSAFYLADIGKDSSIGRGDGTSLAANQGSLIFGGTSGGLVYIGTTSVSTDRLFTMAGTVATAGATITNNAVNNQALIFSNYNPIAFAAANPQLLQLGGTSTSDNWFNPQITDSGAGVNITSLNKLGAGEWILGNTNNTYTGTTTITDGILVAQDGASLPSLSGLILGGTTSAVSVFQSTGAFTRSLVASASAAANTVSWNSTLTTGGGGFAASTDKLIVSIGGLATPATLVWNVGGFMGTSATSTGALILNSVTALGEVEFRNAIDLNGAVRTITVNDNTTTFTDFATISGVISGNGGISKTGTGLLQLLGDNTYTGTTAVAAGQLVVTSLGSSATPGATSLGDSTNGNTAGGALTLGNGSTTAGILQYVGEGEISDRMIRLNTTTGSTQILADGSGALILTNVVNDMASGAKSLYLRGGNTEGNMITSILANNGGNLSIVVDQGATWILGNNNTYSGNTTVSAGALGAGSDTAFGTGTLNMRNGTLFAYGADRTLSNAISVTTTTSGGTFTFMGDYNLTLEGLWTYNNTTTGHTITNGMARGKTLTINGDMLLNALTANVNLALNGTGDTTINGSITTSTAFGVNLNYTGDGTLTFSGVNSTIGNTTLNNVNGTMLLTGAGKLGSGALTVNAGSLLIQSVSQAVTTLTMGNVAGTNATINVASGLTLSATAITFAGTTTLASTITGAGTLDLGTVGITVTVADNITQAADMIWSIDNLTGSNVFTKAGTGVLDLSGIAHNNFNGTYQINAGAIMGLDGLTNNLALNGGVYQTSGLFNRSLGTGANQVQWLALGGGFAAVGADLTVTLAGVPNPLVWGGTASFVPDAAPLIFGSTAADSVTTFTHDIDLNGGVRTVSVVDNTTATTDWAVLSGVLSNGGLTKTGNGILKLSGDNTFAGGLTVTAGTLQFTTIGSSGGGPNNLGQGDITLSGGILSFVADGVGGSQSTDRGITLTASSTLNAAGTNGAIITYAGAITQAIDFSLSLTGTGEGIISGGISQPAGTSVADLNVNSGIWTLRDGTVTIADDVIVTGTTTVLNLNTTGVLAAATTTGTSSGLYARTGAIINLNADDVNGIGNSGGLDFIIIGDSGGPQTAILNTNTFNISTPRLDVGQRAVGLTGQIDGTGTITVAGGEINLYDGTVNANLASTGTIAFEKFGLGTVTLKGDNSGLASTGNSILYEGTLVLDYTVSNTTKLRTASVLEMLGGNLVLTGSASAATSQTVASTNLDASSSSDNSGASTIALNPGAGQDIVLNLGAISRLSANRDGTIRFILPTGTQTSTNGFITTTVNGTQGLLGTSAFATVDDGTGIWFATNATNAAGGNIVALISTVKNDVSTWALGDHVTDDTTGFTGTIQGLNINTLRFNAVAGSDLVIAPNGVLSIASGGILVTSNVGGSPTIQGGTLASGVTELIITQDSAQTFTIGSDIRINHAVTKSGTGTLLLTGNNVYTDETEILQGTLQVAGGNAIGDNSIVSLNAYQDTTLQLLDDETIGRLSGGQRATGSDNGTVAVGTHTLTINEVSSTTYAGFFTGTGKIVKQGAGNLNLTNLSTGFAGIFTIAEGTLQLSGSGQIYASTIRVNKGGTLLIDNNGTTRSGTRILDTTTITLNSADGSFSGQTIVRGLAIRTDQDGTLDETVGEVTAASGASYVGMEATTANDDSDIIASDITRLNNATLNIRGTNLGTTNVRSNQFRIVTSSEAAFISTNLVGGGGAADAKNISIVPWAVGEDLGSNALTASNMGNSLVTYVSGTGFRPLDFTTEYNTLSSAGTTDNARESLNADLTGLTGKTINALVLNNAATPALNVTGSGAGQALGVTSGAMLFTLTGAAANTAYTTTLGGFDSGISVGSTNEYVISVINPNSSNSLTTGTTTLGSSIVTVASTTGLQAGMPVVGAGIALGATVLSVTDATHFVMSLPSTLSASSQTYQYATLESLTATITSSLTSIADITKSGRGTLILSGVNTAGGGTMKTTLNEGILEITSLDNIGGTTGSLVFAGGSLRLGAGFSDDISLRTISFLQGGGTIDTNGIDLVLAQSVGSGVGGLTKIGAGNLTLNAAASYTGATTIAGGTLTLGADNATGVGGDLSIAGGATLDMVTYHITAGLVSFYGDSPMILGSGSITSSVGFYFGNTGNISVATVLAGSGGLLKTQTNTLFLSGLSTFTGPVEVQSGTLSFDSITSVGGGASSLGSATAAQNGIIHMGLGSTATTLTYTGGGSISDRTIQMQGTTGGLTINGNGTGALSLGSIQTVTAGTKTLTLGGTSTADLNNSVALISEFLSTLNISKTGTNTWVLYGANTYTGTTSAGGGILRAANNLAFGSSGVVTLINTGAVLELADGITISNNLSVSDTGNNKSLQLQSGAASGVYAGTITVLEATAGNFDLVADISGTLTISGIITGTGASGISKLGLGTVVLTNDNTYTGATAVNGGILEVTGNQTAAGSLTVGATADTAATYTLSGSGSFVTAAGSNITVGGAAGANAVINVGAGSTLIATSSSGAGGALNVGSGTGYVGVINQSGGTVSADTFFLGASSGLNEGYGFYNQSGGTFTDANAASTSRFRIAGSQGSAIGMYYLSGGTATFGIPTGSGSTSGIDLASSGSASTAGGDATGVIYITGSGQMINASPSGSILLSASINTTVASAATSQITIGGQGSTNAEFTVNRITMDSSIATNSGSSAVINLLNGGTLTTGNFTKNAYGSASLNFDGGTLRAITTSSAGIVSGISVYSYSGGASIDTNGFDYTVSAPILAATGSGVSSISFSGGAGYVGAPAVAISGGSGTGATAVAVIDSTGTVTAVIITNPGTGYAPGDTLAVTFSGGGAATPAVATGVGFTDNTSGGLTKTGAGILVLSGASTYTGDTQVNGGTLQLGSGAATGALSTGSQISMASGAAFVIKQNDVVRQGTDFSGGALSGEGGVAQTGSGTTVLTAANIYSGGTTVSAGTLEVDNITGSGTGSGSVTVSTSGTLSGSGSIDGATTITNGAVLAPGVGATDTSNQTLTFTAAGTAVDVQNGGQIQLGITSSSQVDFSFDFSTTALTYLNTHGGATGTAYTTLWNQSGNYDSIKLTNGTFNLGTTAGGTVKVLNNSATLTSGSIFKLLDWTTMGTLDSLAGSGTFTTTNLDLSGVSLDPGLAWDTSAFTTYGVIVVVPEPSRLLLLMLGLSGFTLRRRRTRI